MLVKLDNFPKVRGENKKSLKPPPRLYRFLLGETRPIFRGRNGCSFQGGETALVQLLSVIIKFTGSQNQQNTTSDDDVGVFVRTKLMKRESLK